MVTQTTPSAAVRRLVDLANQTLRQVLAVGLFGQEEQLIDLGPELVRQFQQPLVADGRALGGIRMHLGAIHL